MRIAYAILVHHKPRQLAWLLEAIWSPTDVFAIHVDAKAPPDVLRGVEALAAGKANVHLLPRRSIAWGGWSLAALNLEAIRTLLELDAGWGYFVNLSGQDYPLRSAGALRAELAAHPDRNYIDARRIETTPQRDRNELRRRLGFCNFEVAGRVVRTPLPILRRRRVRIEWKGGGWYTLSRALCEWIGTDRITRDSIAALRHTYIPDETILQTLAMNGPFAGTVTFDNKRAMSWTGGSHPETLTMRHLERLTRSDAHFARKLDEDVDAEVLRVLADRIGARAP